MALRCAGLSAGALDRDDVRAAADASASLRSRSLAVQVRVHAATERDRLLLDLELLSLDFFLTSPNCTSSCTRPRTTPALFLLKNFDATSTTHAHTRTCADSAGTPTQQYLLPQLQLTLCAMPTGPGPAPALHPPVDRSSGTTRRRRAAPVLLVQVASLVRPPQPCQPCPRMTM